MERGGGIEMNRAGAPGGAQQNATELQQLFEPLTQNNPFSCLTGCRRNPFPPSFPPTKISIGMNISGLC